MTWLWWIGGVVLAYCVIAVIVGSITTARAIQTGRIIGPGAETSAADPETTDARTSD